MSRNKFISSILMSAVLLTLLSFAEPAHASQPTALAAAPATGPQGALGYAVTISGAQFVSGAVAAFSGTGITVTQTLFKSASTIEARLNIASNADTAAARDITVTNPDGGSGKCTGCFTVTAGPRIDSVDPPVIGQGDGATVTIKGSGFNGVAQVGFSCCGVKVQTMAVDGVGNVGTEQSPAANGNMVLQVTVASTASPGTHAITLQTTDGARLSQSLCGAAACFTVAGGKPLINVLSPPSRGAGAQHAKVAVFGRNFASGSTVTFGGDGITVNGTPTLISRGRLNVDISIDPTAAPGPRDVTVTNTDNNSYTCKGTADDKHPETISGCFTVNPAPVVGPPLQPKGPQGIKGLNVTIPGEGFGRGAKAFFGPGIRVERTVWTDSNSPLMATIDIDPTVPAGQKDVVVFNPDGGAGRCTGCFLVTAGPSIAGISPTAIPRGSTNQHITISAPNAVGPVTLQFITASRGHSGITVTSMSPATNGLIEAVIDISSNAVISPRTVLVTAQDGGRGGCTCFNVDWPLPIPKSTNPGGAAQGVKSLKIRVNGSNFAPGSVVSFSGDGKISATSVRSSIGTIYTTITILSDAALGPRDIVVTNPGGTFGACTGCFMVNPEPKVTAVTPPQEPRGTMHQTIQVHGVGFIQGARVDFYCDPNVVAVCATSAGVNGVTVQRTTYVSPTLLQVEISVARNATLGERRVTVYQPDTSSAMWFYSFIVTDGPV